MRQGPPGRWYNGEGYADPTAGAALTEKRAPRPRRAGGVLREDDLQRMDARRHTLPNDLLCALALECIGGAGTFCGVCPWTGLEKCRDELVKELVKRLEVKP